MKVPYNDILFLFRLFLFPFLMMQGERDVHSRQGEPVRRMAVWVELSGQGGCTFRRRAAGYGDGCRAFFCWRESAFSSSCVCR